MNPRRDAALLAALLVLPALALLPAPAQAQGNQSDLQITQVVVAAPRYRVPTTITITIENRGGADFDTASGYQVFVGWNGVADSHCVNDDGSGVNGNKPCYHRVNPALAGQRIGPGEALPVIQIPWTPQGTSASPQRGDGQIFVHLTAFGSIQNGQTTSTGPDQVTHNNVRSFPVTVHSPFVVAVPDRDAAPGASNKSVPWAWEDVTADCAKPPTVNRVACRAQPGTTVRFAYNVHNLGSLPDSFTASVVYDGSSIREKELTDKGYRFTVTPSVVSIPVDGKETVYLEVFVPERELSHQGLNVQNATSPKLSVRWQSSVNPDVHTAAGAHCRDGYECRDPAFPSVIAGIRRGLNATSNETYKPARSSQQVTFNARIENHGNDLDNFSVSLVPERSLVNESWKPRIDTPGFLAAGEAANATIDLLPPEDVPKGLYPFELRFQSQGDHTGLVTSNLTFVVDLQQRYGLLASVVPSSTQAAPGEKGTYTLTVTNTGNGPDNATVSLGNLPGGWDVNLAQTLVQLPPLGQRAVALNITAPPGTRAGTEANVKINVTSQGSNSPSGQPLEKSPEVTASLHVLSRPNVDVRLEGPAKRFVDAGATTEYLLHVRNVGNLPSNFTLGLDSPDPAWGVSGVPSYLVLNPLEEGVMSVRLRAPGDAGVGETLRVIATVRSSADTTRADQETLFGMVSGPDLAVKAIQTNTTAPYSGDPLELDVVLANEGNKAPGRNVTVRLFFLQGGVERVIAERDFLSNDLPGGRRMSERIVWDTTGVEGPGVILARIDPNDAVKEIDETAQSNEASLALTLRTFDITITPPQPLSGRPGEKMGYTERPHVFLVRHRGNSASETVEARIESENGWVDPERAVRLVDLPRGVEVPIPVEVLIPFRPGAASDTLRLVIVPTLRPGNPVSAAVTTTVLDEERPVIHSVVATPAQARVGENVTLAALVRDATGIASVTAHVVAPDNTTTKLPMAHVGGERWALQQTFTVAGAYRFFVEAADRAAPPNVNATRNALVDFFIDPGSAPLIQPAEGQNLTVRSGAPVRLNVTDPLGVAKARYLIRGIAYEMTRPYQIDTSGFPAGTVDVLVEAENVYGAKASAWLNLTIDNTPPGIRKVSLTPESPKINEDAILVIETDLGTAGVDVLIRKDGRVVETRSAERKAPGRFELLLNPGEGDYVLDVTAKDEAGNAKLEEGIVKFSAKPDPFLGIPGPGLLAIVLPLAGLALLLRRR